MKMKLGRSAFLAAAAVALATAAAAPPPAEAEAIQFCPPGSGAGQCSTPRGVAANFSNDRLYVVEQLNNRVSAFKASTREFLFAFGWGVDTGAAEAQRCTVPSGCQAGLSGSGAGQLASPRRIAVDNVSGSGDVYVISRFRVNRFDEEGNFIEAFGWGVETGAGELETCTEGTGCLIGLKGPAECQLYSNNSPVSVGPAGHVFVTDTSGSEPNFTARVQELTPAGECVGETVLAEGKFRPVTLAVDAAKDAYVGVERQGGELRKYALDVPAGEAPTCELDPGIDTNEVALSESGALLAMQREPSDAGGGHLVIAEYEASGCPPGESQLLRRFGYRMIDANMAGVAPGPGGVFGSEPDAGLKLLEDPPPGPLVARTVDPPPALGNVRTTVRAEVNPEGEASEAIVQYVEEASFEEEGFAGPDTETVTAPVPFEAGREFRANAVDVLLGCEVVSEEAIEEEECLTPETTYRWRVKGENGAGDGEGFLEGEPFTTKPPVAMEVFASSVSADTATLNALVNPLSIPATGFFEYVDQGTWEESGFAEAIKVPDVDAEPPEAEYDFGAGEAFLNRSATLYPLEPGTTYRYRLSAQNSFYAGLLSEERSFTTQSPAQGEPSCANSAARIGPGALLPDCRAYELVSPLDKEGGDIVALTESFTRQPAALQQAAVSGERLAYGSYRSFGGSDSSSYASQFIARRTATEWRSHGIDPPHGRPLQDGVEGVEREWRAFSPELCQGWTVPLFDPPVAGGAIAGFRNLYRKEDELCGGPSYEAISTAGPQDVETIDYLLEPQAISADGEVTAFAANDSLEGTESTSSEGAKIQLYVKGPGGGPVFACVLPGGEASKTECSAGTNTTAVGFGTSQLATVTNALSDDGSLLYWTNSSEEGRVYLRENPLGGGGECAEEADSPCSYPVSVDGEAQSGTASSRFWAAAADGSAAYYSTGNLQNGSADIYRYELAAGESTLVVGEAQGFLGASDDAGVAYIASEEAVPGAGANSEGDEAVAGGANLYRYEAAGGGLEFVARLAGADVALRPSGEGVSSATAERPVRRNSRVAADGETVAFMSERPLTGYDNTDESSAGPCGAEGGICDNEVFLYDAEAGELLCASCNPSEARPAGLNVNETGSWIAGRLPVWETTMRAGQVLAADGSRLFFESQDSLVPRDTNERLDVYQWERGGKGGCEASDPGYSEQAGGCLDLISSGQSARDSTFVDASADGDDVFFATLSSLLPQDYGLVDIYDARVGGGQPIPPTPQAGCEGESCQSPPPAPEPPALGSALNSGPPPAASPQARSRCNRAARRAKRLAGRAKRLRRSARRSVFPAARRKRSRAARRSTRAARKLTRNAKRCRARQARR